MKYCIKSLGLSAACFRMNEPSGKVSVASGGLDRVIEPWHSSLIPHQSEASCEGSSMEPRLHMHRDTHTKHFKPKMSQQCVCVRDPVSSVLGITHSVSINGKHGFSLRQAGRIVDFTDPRLSSAFPQIQTANTSTRVTHWCHCVHTVLSCYQAPLKDAVTVKQTHSVTHRVVEAWAIMLPPIGFLGSAENMAAPSTCATTWLVITTATPNCCNTTQFEPALTSQTGLEFSLTWIM